MGEAIKYAGVVALVLVLYEYFTITSHLNVPAQAGSPVLSK